MNVEVPYLLQDLQGYCIIYLRYLQEIQRLNTCSSRMIQAQKLKDLRRCLECAIARMLEIRCYLVSPASGPHRMQSRVQTAVLCVMFAVHIHMSGSVMLFVAWAVRCLQSKPDPL